MSENTRIQNRKRKFKKDHMTLDNVITDKPVNTKVPMLAGAKVRKLQPLQDNSGPIAGNQR